MTAVETPGLNLADLAAIGSPPLRVLRVSTVGELCDLVANAAAAGTPLVPLGGRTALGRGNASPDAVLGIDLRDVSGIVEYVPDDMTVTLRAGTSLGELTETLAPRLQLSGVEGASADEATVGGAIACASWGPHVGLFGRIRDRVLGIQTVDGNGIALRAGGKVVKNVSGYDLTKLHIGALGSLGVITEVTLKVFPVSGERIGLETTPAGLETLLPMASATRIFALSKSDAGWRATLEWLGPADAIRERRSVVRRAAEGAGLSCEHLDGGQWDQRWRTSYAGSLGGWNVEVYFPRSAARRVLGFADALPGNAWLWPADGVGRLLIPPRHGVVPVLEALRREMESLDGRMIIESRPAGEPPLDAWGTAPEPAALHRAIKQSFDPAAILNRGRFWGGL